MIRLFNPFLTNFLFLEAQKTSEDLWFLTFLGGIEIQHGAKLGETAETFVSKIERNRASAESFFPISNISARSVQMFVNYKGSFI